LSLTSVIWAASRFGPTIYYRSMNLQSLLVCSDDRTVRVLRQVLDDLEIGVEHCAHPTPAQKKLASQTFEAVIVDCTGEPSLSLLKDIRKGQHNKKSVGVAIVHQQTALHHAFEMGAHFVIYKPISRERAKASFRAAKAVMKRERRRSLRVQVHIPVSLRFQNGEGEHAFISGLSEGGISVDFSLPCRTPGVVGLRFTLPGAMTQIEATGLIAWHNFDGHARAGIRFTKLSDRARVSLKEWLHMKSGEKIDLRSVAPSRA
jgi:CheY-like chemotaxis protein